jgi:membrane protease YdiL (CAAX protease family)
MGMMSDDERPITANETRPGPRRDPGSRAALWLAILGGIILYVYVGFLQNSGGGNASSAPSDGEAPVAEVGGGELGLEADLIYRLSIRLKDILEADPNADRMLAAYATTDREKLGFAVAIGELGGPEAALEHLPIRTLGDDSELNPSSDDEQFWADVDAFERIYLFARDGGTGSPVEAGVIDQKTADGLRDRYGFYAEVALTNTLDPDAPERTALRTPGAEFVGVLLIVLLVAGAILAGFALFVTAIVLIGLGKIKPAFERPAPGGSVFLEVFTLFVAGFLLLKFGIALSGKLPGVTPEGLALTSLLFQWLLLAIPLWPLVRGMKWEAYHKAIGLHRGRGVLREMGAGVLGYLAGLPIFLGAVLLVVVLLSIKGMMSGSEAPPPSNPMVELVGGASPLMLVMFFVLATVWAPLCEELVFRGALYRHLRGYMPAVLSALVGGVLFAFMHNYGVLLTPPLIALGFNFSMMREWRGSLIAPMTAHLLHNGTLLTLVILLFKAVSG